MGPLFSMYRYVTSYAVLVLYDLNNSDKSSLSMLRIHVIEAAVYF